jgi:hypothetical protein
MVRGQSFLITELLCAGLQTCELQPRNILLQDRTLHAIKITLQKLTRGKLHSGGIKVAECFGRGTTRRRAMRRLVIAGVFVSFSILLAAGGIVSAQTQGAQAGKAKDEFKTVRGDVAEFTMGPDEIINGLVLKDGTRVHWPEEITFRFTQIVDVGDPVEISGRPGNTAVLEVRTLTNLNTRKTATNEKVEPPAKG